MIRDNPMTQYLKHIGIYILTNRKNGRQYVGKDKRLGSRPKEHLALKAPNCRAIHNAIKKHGADNFDIELISYPNISDKALAEVERWKIRQLGSHGSKGGYNLAWGGEGFDSESARKINHKRIEDGTHHLLGGKANRKRVKDGTHHFLGDNNPSHKRIENGTHHFLVKGFQREVQFKRSSDGTHHFLGGDIQRKNNRKRFENGTHNFQDPQFYRKRAYNQRIKRKNQRREFYRWVSVILTAKSVCEERIYQKRIRDRFFDKEIPDTSKSEQLDLL